MRAIPRTALRRRAGRWSSSLTVNLRSHAPRSANSCSATGIRFMPTCVAATTRRALEPYLARDPGSGEYERIAARLRSRQMTLVLALKRLRQRLHELAGEELSDTVSTASDLAHEQNALLAVLGELH